MTSAGTITVTLDAKTQRFSMAVQKASAKLSGLDPVARAAGKAMEKLQKETGGFTKAIQAAAAAAAALGGVMKAFGLAEAAAGAATATQAFKALGGSLTNLRTATMGMVSDSELVKKANLAQTMGISGKAFQKLSRIALSAAAKTGQSFTFLFDSIITGTARSSKMILDNLGILVNVGAANRDYAKSLGISVKAMSDAQKQQAFMSAAMKSGENVIRELQQAGIDIFDPFARMRAVFANVADAVGSLLVPGFKVFARLAGDVEEAVTGLKDKFATLTPAGERLAEKIGAIAIGLATAVGLVGLATAGFGALVPVIKAGTVGILGMLGPLLTVLVIIAGLVSAISVMRVAWEKNWFGIRNTTATGAFEIAETIFNAAKAILTAFFTVTNEIAKAIDILVGGAVDVFNVFLQGLALAFLEGEVAVLEQKLFFQGVFTDITQFAVDMAKDILGAFKKLSELPVVGAAFEFDEALAKKQLAFFDEVARKQQVQVGQLEAQIKQKRADIDPLVEGLRIDAPEKIAIEDPEKVAEAVLAFPGELRDALSALGGPAATQLGKDIKEALITGGRTVGEGLRLILKDLGLDDLFGKAKEQLTIKPPPRPPGDPPEADKAKKLEDVTFARLDEFNDAMALAAAGAGEFADIDFDPQNLSDLMTGRVDEAFGAFAKAFDLDFGDDDQKTIVGNISDALQSLIEGGELDFGAIGKALGSLIGGTKGGAGFFGDLFGIAQQGEGAAAEGAPAAGQGMAAAAPSPVSAIATIAEPAAGIAGPAVGAAGAALPGVGAIVGAVAGVIISAVLPALIDAFKKVAGFIVEAVQFLPNLVKDAATGIADQVGDARLKEVVEQVFNPLFPIVGAVVAVIAGLAAVFAPFAPIAAALVTVLAGTVLAVGIVAAALVAVLAPAVIVVAAVTVAINAAIVAVIGVLGVLVGLLALATTRLLVQLAAIAALIIVVLSLLNPLFLLTVVAAALVSVGFLPLLLVAVLLAAAFGFVLAAIGLAIGLAVAGIMLFVGAMSLATKTDSFERFQAGFETSTDRAVAAMEPFFEGMLALVGLFDIFLDVLIPLFGATANLGIIATVLFEVFKALAIVVAAVVLAVATAIAVVLAVGIALATSMAGAIEGLVVFNSQLQALPDAIKGEFFQILEVFARGFRDIIFGLAAMIPGVEISDAMKERMQSTIDGLDEISDAARQSAQDLISDGTNPTSDALRDLADDMLAVSPDLKAMGDAFIDLVTTTKAEALEREAALNDQREVEEEFNESMLNVPKVLNVIGARLRAAEADVVGVTDATEEVEAAGQTIVQISIETLTAVANDPDELTRVLIERVEEAQFTLTGSISDQLENPGFG